MTLFWFLAAVLLIVAMGFIWWPIWRYKSQHQRSGMSQRDINVQAYRSRIDELDTDFREGRVSDAQYQSLKSELERNLLADTQIESNSISSSGPSLNSGVAVAIVLSGIFVFAAAGLYWQLGSSQILSQMEQHQALSEKMAEMTAAQRVGLFKERVAAAPEKPELWYALAQGYLQTKQYLEAEDAYNRVLLLVGEDPQVLAEYAQALFFVAGNRITDKVKGLVDRTLAVDPVNDTALGLLGIDAFEREDYAAAIEYWQRILDGSENQRDVQVIRAGIARAQKMLAEQAGGPVAVASDATNENAAVALKVEVSLSATQGLKTSPEQTVFVFARAVNGPPMPLAAVRLQVQDLPTQVVLNDAMAMTPQAKLSSFEQVEVIARVSLSQSATARPGDLQGKVGPIDLSAGSTSIKILIDHTVE